MSIAHNYTAGNRGSNYHWQLVMTGASVKAGPYTMAGSASGANFVNKEIPSGAMNGVNTVFTLSFTPVAGSEYVFLDGQLLTGGGVDYTLSGNTITFNIAPTAGEQLFVSYRH